MPRDATRHDDAPVVAQVDTLDQHAREILGAPSAFWESRATSVRQSSPAAFAVRGRLART
jgi:hypothetical protein